MPAPNAPRLHWKLQRLQEDNVLAVYVDEFTRNIALISAEIDHHLVHNDLDLNAIEQISQQITTAIYDALDHSVTCGKDRPKEWKWFWNEELQQLATIWQQKYE